MKSSKAPVASLKQLQDTVVRHVPNKAGTWSVARVAHGEIIDIEHGCVT
jgi:hypothetical protein